MTNRFDRCRISQRDVHRRGAFASAAAVFGGAEVAGRVAATGGGQSACYPWYLHGCQVVIAVVPVEAERLAEHLPEVFRPQTPEAFGLPPDPRGDGEMGVEAFVCDEIGSTDGGIEDAPYVSYFAPVEPPDDLEDPDARYHFVKWDVLIGDDELRTMLQDEGVPAASGDVTYDFEERSAGEFSYDLIGTVSSETHRFTGSGQLPEGVLETFTFLEFTGTSDGLVSWDVSVEDAAVLEGTGTLELATGSLPAEVIGAEVTQAYVLAGDRSLEDVTITVPRPGGCPHRRRKAPGSS